jgi:hypothetical protein
MAKLLIVLLSVQDAPQVTVAPGEPTEKVWTVKGTAAVVDGATLVVAARRIERRWDAKESAFREILSDEMRRRGSAIVTKQAFEAMMKAGSAGVYQLVVAEGEKQLHETRAALGRADRLFVSTREHVKKLAECADRAKACLDEIERIVKAGKPPGQKAFEDFTKRLSKEEELLERARIETDLSGAVGLLRDVTYQLRNAQVWSTGSPTGPAENDLVIKKKGFFLDPELSLKDLYDTISLAKTVLSIEIRVSIAAILDDVLARADSDKAQSRARDAVKEGATLAALAPEADAEFVKLLDQTDAAALRAGLQAVLAKRIKK